MRRAATTDEELWRQLQQAWDEIPIEYINKVIDSMPKRVAAVHDAEGGPIKY